MPRLRSVTEMYQSCQPWYPQQTTRSRPVKARAPRTRGRGGVAPRLGEADAVGARDHRADQLGHLHLERVHQREGDPASELVPDGLVDGGVGVAERQRPDPHGPVDVLVAVDVHTRAPSPRSLQGT